jgi:hypothetical protein
VRQTVEHDPQCPASFDKFTHAVPHTLSPNPWQAQAFAEQDCPVGQVRPHAPQFTGSVDETQTPLHTTPLSHRQVPWAQTSPVRHARSHAPQCARSVWRLAQSLPHTV